MEWAILLAILYVPVVYRINRRLRALEQEVNELQRVLKAQ